MSHPLADLRGCEGTPPSKFFKFHAVFGGELAKSYVSAPKGLARPLTGNPGSATDTRGESEESGFDPQKTDVLQIFWEKNIMKCFPEMLARI